MATHPLQHGGTIPRLVRKQSRMELTGLREAQRDVRQILSTDGYRHRQQLVCERLREIFDSFETITIKLERLGRCRQHKGCCPHQYHRFINLSNSGAHDTRQRNRAQNTALQVHAIVTRTLPSALGLGQNQFSELLAEEGGHFLHRCEAQRLVSDRPGLTRRKVADDVFDGRDGHCVHR